MLKTRAETVDNEAANRVAVVTVIHNDATSALSIVEGWFIRGTTKCISLRVATPINKFVSYKVLLQRSAYKMYR